MSDDNANGGSWFSRTWNKVKSTGSKIWEGAQKIAKDYGEVISAGSSALVASGNPILMGIGGAIKTFQGLAKPGGITEFVANAADKVVEGGGDFIRKILGGGGQPDKKPAE